MKIQIDVKPPRWVSRSPRWAKLLVVASLALATVAVPIAWATDTFADVPFADAHHDDINRIAVAGITQGCNPPANTLYCPDQFVRRDQMATFLRRGVGRVGRATANPNLTHISVGEQTLASVTLTLPGQGFVLVTGSMGPNATAGCPCRAVMRVRDATSGAVSSFVVDRVSRDILDGFEGGQSVTHVFGPVAAGNRVFQVRGYYYGPGSTIQSNVTITALWVPFGSAGTNVLGSEDGAASVGPMPGSG